MNNWIEEWKQEGRDLESAYNELKRRHDYAIEALADLAQGVGIKPTWWETASNRKWEDAMKHKAAHDLTTIAKMPLRNKPYIRTY